ncbi:MAG: autotransporter-associated beta strand repeat-containing protein, partial [Puniceicoccales bacterium]|nr:autotransporter-associated beta strand repeat-containing protein [Puniceicoccales bacterium]
MKKFLLPLALLASAAALNAATINWGTGDGDWTATTFHGTAYAPGDTLVFNGATGGTVTVKDSITAAQVQFAGGAAANWIVKGDGTLHTVTLTGNAFSFVNGNAHVTLSRAERVQFTSSSSPASNSSDGFSLNGVLELDSFNYNLKHIDNGLIASPRIVLTGSTYIRYTGGSEQVYPQDWLPDARNNRNNNSQFFANGNTNTESWINITREDTTLEIWGASRLPTANGNNNQGQRLMKTGPGTLVITGSYLVSWGGTNYVLSGTAVGTNEGEVIITGNVGTGQENAMNKDYKEYAITVQGTGKVTLVNDRDNTGNRPTEPTVLTDSRPAYFPNRFEPTQIDPKSGVKMDGGTFDLNGHNEYIAYLDGSGGVIVNTATKPASLGIQFGDATWEDEAHKFDILPYNNYHAERGRYAQDLASTYGGRIADDPDKGAISIGLCAPTRSLTLYTADPTDSLGHNYRGATNIYLGALQLGTPANSVIIPNTDIIVHLNSEAMRAITKYSLNGGMLEDGYTTETRNGRVSLYQVDGLAGKSISGTGSIVKEALDNTVTLPTLENFTGIIRVRAGTLEFTGDAHPSRLAVDGGGQIKVPTGKTMILDGDNIPAFDPTDLGYLNELDRLWALRSGVKYDTNILDYYDYDRKSNIGRVRISNSVPTNLVDFDVVGNLRVSGGHKLFIGANSALTEDQLSVSGLLTVSQARLYYNAITSTGTPPRPQTGDPGVATSSDIIYTNALSASGENTILFQELKNSTAFYKLITVATGASISDEALASFVVDGATASVKAILESPDVSTSFTRQDDGRTLVLNVVYRSSPESLLWNGTSTAAGRQWDYSEFNWLVSDSSNAKFAERAAVEFRDGGERTVNIDTPVNPFSLQVDVSEFTQPLLFSFGAAGKLTGTTGIAKAGSGTLVLRGNAESSLNDFTGVVSIRGGVLELAGQARLLGNRSQSSVLGSGASSADLLIDSGVLRFSGDASNATTTNRTFTMGYRGATLEVASTAANTRVFFTGAYASADAVIQNGAGSRTLTLTGAGGASALSPDGAVPNATAGGAFGLRLTDVSDGNGSRLAVEKTGAGVWHLTNVANTFTGGLTISQGALAVSADGALGGAANIVTLNGGALVNATASPNDNLLLVPVPEIVLSHRIAVGAAGGDVSVLAGTVLTSDGLLSGSGLLGKRGSGTLVLTAGNTSFQGGTRIYGGVLRTTNPYALGFGSVSVDSGARLQLAATDGDGLTLTGGLLGQGTVENIRPERAVLTLNVSDASGSVIFSGDIVDGTGPLAVHKLGSGTQTLGGAGNYSGGLEVSGGILRLASAAALGSSPALVRGDNGGGTLDIAGQNLSGRPVVISGEGAANRGVVLDSIGGGVLPDLALGAASTVRTFGGTRLGLARTAADVSGVQLLSLGAAPAPFLTPDPLWTLDDLPVFVAGVGSSVEGVGLRLLAGVQLRLDANERLAASTPVEVRSGAALSISSLITQTLGVLSGGGSVRGQGTLVLAPAVQNLEFGGTLDGGVNLTLTRGVVTLTNPASTTTGVITVGGTPGDGAVLRLEDTLTASGTGTDVLGSASSVLALSNGVVRFLAPGASETARSLLLDGQGGTLSAESGAVRLLGSSLFGQSSVNYRLELTGPGTGGNVLRAGLEDPLAGELVLVKTGTGTWQLDGANVYTGGT